MRILQSNLEASLAPGQGREGAGEGGGLQVESESYCLVHPSWSPRPRP